MSSAAENARRVKIIRSVGMSNANDIVRALPPGLPLSMACAMLQMETNGANVFGHDPVRRGQVFGGRVTRARYLFYKARRRALGNQGVGPCQLTSTFLQDDADRRGGCWKPLHNMEVGFLFLRGLYQKHGTAQLAFQFYNGSGAAAVHYGDVAANLVGVWHRRFS